MLFTDICIVQYQQQYCQTRGTILVSDRKVVFTISVGKLLKYEFISMMGKFRVLPGGREKQVLYGGP